MSDLSPRELDRLIRHLREKDQFFIENIGGWRREVKTDHCIAADYLEALRRELPGWQLPPEPENTP